MVTRLILDELSVEAATGVTFHLDAATRRPENPVLLPGEPHQWDSLQVSWPGTVLYSPRDEKFRCWYSGFDAVQRPGRMWEAGYAESDDGVHWSKPELGQSTYLDRPTNRIATDWEVFAQSFTFENPDTADPSRRFGSYWLDAGIDEAGNQHPYLRKGLAWSPDGKTWTRAGAGYEKKPYPGRYEMQDISQLLFDPDEPDPAYRVKGYAQIFLPRAWDGRLVRQIGLVHGEYPARVTDAPDPVALAPDPEVDEELHFASVKKVGNTYMMLFESDRFSKNPIDGDLRLAVSEDGRKFRRVHKHAAFLDTGAKGMWDENLLVTSTSALQEVGDEVYLYYFGCPNVYNSWPAQYAVVPERRGSQFYPVYLGLAIFPRDRYAYARGPGTLALTAKADELWLNVDGDIALTANDVAGHLGDERRQTVYRKVIWDSKPPAGECTVEFKLASNARLYSIWSADL